jgi:hypothetical protein
VKEVTLAEDQEQYCVLTAGMVNLEFFDEAGTESPVRHHVPFWVVRYTFSAEDRKRLAEGEDVFISFMKTGAFPPIQGFVGCPTWTTHDDSKPRPEPEFPAEEMARARADAGTTLQGFAALRAAGLDPEKLDSEAANLARICRALLHATI